MELVKSALNTKEHMMIKRYANQTNVHRYKRLCQAANVKSVNHILGQKVMEKGVVQIFAYLMKNFLKMVLAKNVKK